jgi:hypothetical protein
MTSPALQFPVLSIGRNVYQHVVPGEECVDYFRNENAFAICSADDLKRHALDGMLLADSGGRCWKIVGVQDLGVTGPLWDRVLRFLLQQSIHRISCDLEEVEALSLDALKERVLAIITADPERWKDDEAVAGEAGPPRDEQEMLDELRNRVRMAPSVPEIIYALLPEERPD